MMPELALNILDIAENSVRAGASRVAIAVAADSGTGLLSIVLEDNGPGIAPELAARVFDPFVTSRTERRVGLGLPFLRQAAQQCGGDAVLESAPGRGARVTATFGLRHLDRQPLGNLGATVSALLAGAERLDVVLALRCAPQSFRFDSAALRDELGQDCFRDPAVLAYVEQVVSGAQHLAGLD